MDGKKYPGKFTIRFNLSDPQQRQAAEFLNRQGRSKAQFIANAVLHYTSGQVSIPQAPSMMNSDQLRHLVEDILDQQQNSPRGKVPAAPIQPTAINNDTLNDAERNIILQTLDAFQKQ